MSAFAFDKYEGLGNDFIVVDAASDDEMTLARAIDLCDRRRGVGADGVLIVLPSRDTECVARMKVINADGSVPEMCGNGLRCVALRFARTRGLTRAEFAFDTDAGARACVIDDTNGKGFVTVDMGIVRVLGPRALDLSGTTMS